MLSCVCSPVYRLAVATLSFCLVVFTFDRVSAADRPHRSSFGSSHVAIDAVDRSGGWPLQEVRFGLSAGFIPSSPVATAATLNGDAEIAVTGAIAMCALTTRVSPTWSSSAV